MPGNHDYYDFRIDDEAQSVHVTEEHGAAFLQNSELFAGSDDP